MIREVGIGKKGLSKFLEKAPDIRELENKERLNKLREKDEFFNRGNNNNNDINSSFILRSPPPPPYPEFPRQNFLLPPPQSPNLSDFFLDNYIPPPPLQQFFHSPVPTQPGNITFQSKNGVAINTTETLSGDRLIGELKKVIGKDQPKENLVPDEDIIFTLPKLPGILDNDYFEKKQEIKKQQGKEINDEIDLTRLKDEIDSGEIPK